MTPPHPWALAFFLCLLDFELNPPCVTLLGLEFTMYTTPASNFRVFLVALIVGVDTSLSSFRFKKKSEARAGICAPQRSCSVLSIITASVWLCKVVLRSLYCWSRQADLKRWLLLQYIASPSRITAPPTGGESVPRGIADLRTNKFSIMT